MGGYFGVKSVREPGSSAFATKQKSEETSNTNKEGTSKFNKKLTGVLNNLSKGISEEDIKSLESLAKTEEDKSFFIKKDVLYEKNEVITERYVTIGL
ncbi:hypothetical protein [uncultured Streptococcus sp.]|uniref:hypothetical protein n=1 Tax=uncultured Streptococcus sp. TaxID=83427 RepID=UPI00262DA7D3|nr:hypothetical protein [uncultured Streptococcus sp.]